MLKIIGLIRYDMSVRLVPRRNRFEVDENIMANCLILNLL